MDRQAPSQDQATQVNFPVLLRHQQKILKRFATVNDINKVMHNRLNVNPVNSLGRPRSLHYSGNSFELTPVANGSYYRDREAKPKSHHHNTHSLDFSPNVILNPGSLTPGHRPPTLPSASSYDGSDVSFSGRHSPGFVCSGQFRSVHQGKWKIGTEQPDSLSTTKTTCSCFQETGGGVGAATKELRHTTTPEGLSWRRLHMSRAKLKATATTSELLSGFAMVAMVELQINEPTTVPEWLFVLFAVCTTVLVAVHIFALMISTYILPNIDAISKLDVCELVSESPHERMRGFIELAWAFSTVLGLFLFLVEIAILCWVKFWDYSFTAAIAATVIVIPVLIMFVAFAVHFYHSLVVYKCDASVSDIQKLEDMKKELDQAINPV